MELKYIAGAFLMNFPLEPEATCEVECQSCGGGGIAEDGSLCTNCKGHGTITITERDFRRLKQEEARMAQAESDAYYDNLGAD